MPYPLEGIRLKPGGLAMMRQSMSVGNDDADNVLLTLKHTKTTAYYTTPYLLHYTTFKHMRPIRVHGAPTCSMRVTQMGLSANDVVSE